MSKESIATRFKPRHGRAVMKLGAYGVWLCMKQRCNYEGHKSYASYGGRGIKVCERWVSSFEAFLADMGDPPDGMQLGRIDNDAGYEPGNCRWETASQQARNRRSTCWVSAFGEVKPLVEWAEKHGMRADTLKYRLKAGMNAEAAMTKPVATPVKATRWTA